jgi:hypothetical protein
MAIMIRVVLPDVSIFLWEFLEFLYFLECPPRILSGFMWRLQKKPSN